MISIILSVLDEDKKEKVQEIYNRLGNTMYSIALGILRDKHHAQDAVSETFIKISTYITQSRNRSLLYCNIKERILQNI